MKDALKKYLILILLLSFSSLFGEEEKADPKDSGYVLFPIVFYTPETKVGAGATAVLFKKHYKSETEEKSDSLSAVFLYTMQNQMLSALVGDKYFDKAFYHIKLTSSLSRFPQKYYGVGNDTNASDEEGYTPFYVKNELVTQVRTVEKIYAGTVIIPGYYKLLDSENNRGIDSYYQSHPENGWFTGGGFQINRDSRDATIYPTKGSNSIISAVFFRKNGLSSYDFNRYLIDHRTYLPAFFGGVFAFQLYGESVTGEPPLNYVPRLGGQNLLRGYYQGRYMDNIYLAAQTEYRVPIYWRLGATFFGAAGNVYDKFENINGKKLKYSGGFGLRFALNRQKNINFRFDLGVSPDDVNVYFNVLEAF